MSDVTQAIMWNLYYVWAIPLQVKTDNKENITVSCMTTSNQRANRDGSSYSYSAQRHKPSFNPLALKLF